MSTITSLVRRALEDAPPVPLEMAQPPASPGWYALRVGGEGSVVHVGETADLAERMRLVRARLHGRQGIDPTAVICQWIEAERYLGEHAGSRRSRTAVQKVLMAIFQTEWDSEGFASSAEDVPWALAHPRSAVAG